jgi:fatty-acyl-CoA synthase
MRQTRQESERGSLFFSARVLFVLVVLLPPFWVRVALSPAGGSVDRIVRTWARRALRWSGCRVTISGAEHLERAPCALLVANHSSVIDSVVLMASVPARFRFVANHLAATRPFIGLAVRKAGHLIVDRGSAASRAACGRAMIEALRAGTSLMVFPEGTRAAEALLPFQIGAFRVALAAGRPVVPIAIVGTRQVLPRRLRLLRPAPITVTVLPPIAHSPSRTAAELRDQVVYAIARQVAASTA